MDATISFTVNGKKQTVTTDPKRPLLDVLREDLHLLGSKFGCGESQCGACSVLVDGKRVFSCHTQVSKVADAKILTIEGLADGDKLHPVQQAYVDEGAFQCGYCTAGMIMATVELLAETPKPTHEQIVEHMNGNICRCCSHNKILNAIHRAAGTEVTSVGH